MNEGRVFLYSGNTDMKLYHMAQKGTLKKGDVINPIIINNIDCMNSVMTKQLQDYYNEQFPDGVCKHREMYFAYWNKNTYLHPLTELLFEKTRRSVDSNLPSRANVIFAIDNPEKFSYLCPLMNLPLSESEFWEVESSCYLKADMFLMDRIEYEVFNNGSILVISKLIDDYWKGKSICDFIENDEPFWEYLLQPPILIKEKFALK